ncbi:AAA family ATPase [Streptobacillus canis]|uniref:AAA family ATPase n=1 Tax=Streptobacillus canis TaxID=2678686 RepID=UPI0012E1F403|nr:AAA family ATPase [Streptobacillus canis]
MKLTIEKESPTYLLRSYVEALFPIIYINHFDFKYVDELIEKANLNKDIIEYIEGLGVVDSKTRILENEISLVDFLKTIKEFGYENDNVIILKDVHNSLNNIEVISGLKEIIYRNSNIEGYGSSIIIVSSKLNIPIELKEYITILDIPLPENQEIKEILTEFQEDFNIKIEKEILFELKNQFKGLNRFQIIQILNLALQKKGVIDKDGIKLILKTKEQLIKKNGLIDLIRTDDDIESIGGLENLKSWLSDKEKVFRKLTEAIKFGVDIPKGMLITGLPGCGKSLCAKATSGLFKLPLLRLDVGRLLGKYVGESEENMKMVLEVVEAISPCILWIDEVEKAFSGVGNENSGSEVTTRLFGQFLTWMQEKKSNVFVVATANDVSKLPSEFLRKGRFDEIFFVELPKLEERKKILTIHLNKRNKNNSRINIDQIAKITENYSGADLETIVKNAVEKIFINNKLELETIDLENAVKEIKGMGKSFKNLINNIRKNNINYGFKKANKGGR